MNDFFKQFQLGSNPDKSGDYVHTQPSGADIDPRVILDLIDSFVVTPNLLQVAKGIVVGSGTNQFFINPIGSVKTTLPFDVFNTNLYISQSSGSGGTSDKQSEIQFYSTDPNSFTGELNNVAYKIYRQKSNGDLFISDISGSTYIEMGGGAGATIQLGAGDNIFQISGGQSSTYVDITRRSNSPVIHFPNFESPPSTCSIGDITVASGKLYICTAANTWTVVGTQT